MPSCYYRSRHQIEKFFDRFKAQRRISTRYEKLAATFLAFVQLAAPFSTSAPTIFANTP
jgi:transposase